MCCECCGCECGVSVNVVNVLCECVVDVLCECVVDVCDYV